MAVREVTFLDNDLKLKDKAMPSTDCRKMDPLGIFNAVLDFVFGDDGRSSAMHLVLNDYISRKA